MIFPTDSDLPTASLKSCHPVFNRGDTKTRRTALPFDRINQINRMGPEQGRLMLNWSCSYNWSRIP